MFLCEPYNNGKLNMGYIKFKRIKKVIGLVLFLVIGFSPLASGFAAGSDCGNMCAMDSVMRNIGFTAKANAVSTSQGCCSENSMIPCDLASGQTVDLPECITSRGVDDQKTSGLIMVASYDFLGDLRLKSFSPKSHAKTLALFTPIYLENLSLLF
ncbi:MAG: hypothetical protein OEM90_07230 [Desulfobacteraceae bacterium]|nr:hypothetical protein [Desulfobacteraceae bacterium]